MGKIRNFLKYYEIFFTTTCAVILSCMGIVISIKSCQIAERQYNVDYFEKKADFQINENQILDPNTNHFDEIQLDISKISGQAKNIDIDVIVFFDVKTIDYKNNRNNKRFNLYDFYGTSFISGNTDGKIQTIYGYKNNKKYVEFERSIYNLLQQKYQFVETGLTTIVKISYLNFLSENIVEYYKIESFGGRLIEDSEIGINYFSEHDKNVSLENIIELNDLDKMNIKKIISQL